MKRKKTPYINKKGEMIISKEQAEDFMKHFPWTIPFFDNNKIKDESSDAKKIRLIKEILNA